MFRSCSGGWIPAIPVRLHGQKCRLRAWRERESAEKNSEKVNCAYSGS